MEPVKCPDCRVPLRMRSWRRTIAVMPAGTACPVGRGLLLVMPFRFLPEFFPVRIQESGWGFFDRYICCLSLRSAGKDDHGDLTVRVPAFQRGRVRAIASVPEGCALVSITGSRQISGFFTRSAYAFRIFWISFKSSRSTIPLHFTRNRGTCFTRISSNSADTSLVV